MLDGFYIKKLVVIGTQNKKSQLEFKKGFNLISGVSDTGKSYAFSCIDFLLGRSENPKEIPEAIGYEDFYLQISTYKEKPLTIYRNIKNTDVYIKECTFENYDNTKKEEKLLLNHSSSSENNLSVYLLKTCGMYNKEFKKKKTEKKKISFRDLRKFTVIPEDRIITEKSPIYATGQYPDQTFYQSLFRYILSGTDDSNFINPLIEKEKKTHILGQIEFIISERDETNREITALSAKKALLDDGTDYSQVINKTKLDIDGILTVSSDINKEIMKINDDILENENKKEFKKELINRFKLLLEHYNSDLERMQFVSEGNSLISQLNTVACPICDSEITTSELDSDFDEEVFNESIEAEYKKISNKKNDISESIVNLEKEVLDINSELSVLSESKIEAVKKKKHNNEKIIPFKEKLERFEQNQIISNKVTILTERINYLFEKEAELNEKIEKGKSKPDSEHSEEFLHIKDFCTKLSSILEGFGYPGWESITFDTGYRTFDYTISGKTRKSFGKGFRAISYSALLISILDWVVEKGISFNPLIVLDSPLTTYHGKNALRETNDEISEDIQDRFFDYLSDTSEDRQIIVFDNKTPQQKIINKINFIYFCGNTEGDRRGFIE